MQGSTRGSINVVGSELEGGIPLEVLAAARFWCQQHHTLCHVLFAMRGAFVAENTID